MARVLVCGAVNLDVTMNVSRFPHPGETLVNGRINYAQGGKGANQAVAAARAGASTSFIGAVGDDEFGRRVASELRKHEVHLNLEKSLEEPTGVAIILVDSMGESSVVVDLGANRLLSSSVAEITTFAPNDVVLIQNEIPLQASQAFAVKARQAGATVIVNASPFTPGCVEGTQAGDYLIFNEVEYAQYIECPVGSMTVADVESSLVRSVDTLQPNLIVTVGAQGVRAFTENQLRVVPGHQVNPVDTTGAGDCFCGSFSAALAQGMKPDQCLAFANAAAALSVQLFGAGPSMPSHGQTVSFFSNQALLM